MAKIWVTLGAALAIGAAAFTQSSPAAAHEWMAPAASYCHGAYYGGGCCGNEPRGLFTSGFFGGCGCGSWHDNYGPASYYTQPAEPYVQPYSYPNHAYPYVRPYYRPLYRHYYHPYVRHGLYRYGAYHHGVHRTRYYNGHMHH